jgi:putative membrane protein
LIAVSWTASWLSDAVGALVACAYAVGARAARFSARRQACFAAGVLACATALSTRVEELAARLFSVHMAQHLLLTLVAPPLLVGGRPGLPLVLAAPLPARRAGRRVASWRPLRAIRSLLRRPLVVLLAYTAAFWAWHLPGAYQAALRDPSLHLAEHACFFGSALALWGLVLEPGPRRRVGHAAAVPLVFCAMLQNVWLAALLSLTTTPLYPLYVQVAKARPPLADQQLAGVLMWVPADLLYFATMAWLGRRALEEVQHRAARSQGGPAVLERGGRR